MARVHREDSQAVLADHRRVLTLATTVYQEALWHHRQGLTYLGERAISRETARSLGLGYSDGRTLLGRLKTSQTHWKEASEAGLLTPQRRERLAGRLIVPERRDQHTVYLIGRIVPPGSSRQKYLGIAAKKRLLGYGEAMAQIRQSDQPVKGLLVVEGALDFVLAWQWQLPVCCVALLSTCASQLQIEEIAELHACIEQAPVFVGLDADASGARSTPRLLSQLQQRGLPAQALPSLDGTKDLGELALLPDGRQRFWQALSQALEEDQQVPNS